MEKGYSKVLEEREKLLVEIREAASYIGATVVDCIPDEIRFGYNVEFAVQGFRRFVFVKWEWLIDQDYRAVIREIKRVFPYNF